MKHTALILSVLLLAWPAYAGDVETAKDDATEAAADDADTSTKAGTDKRASNTDEEFNPLGGGWSDDNGGADGNQDDGSNAPNDHVQQ